MNSSNLPALVAAAALTGCVFDGGEPVNDPAPSAQGKKLFVMGQKYTTSGGTAALDRVGSDSSIATSLKTWESSDNVLGTDSTGLYVIERGTGAVTRYEGGDISRRSFQVSAGAEANPYAVAVSGGKVWVACYGSAYLKAIDPAQGKLVDSIDLGSYSDLSHNAAIPNAIGVASFGTKIAVVLGRMNGWSAGDSSLVLVLDPSSKQVEKRIALPWKNAYGVSWNGSQALVSCLGSWKKLDGGVALVDLQAGTARAVVTEQVLGGDAAKAAFGPSGKFFAGISDTVTYSVSVKVVDLASGTPGAKVSGAVDVGDLAWDGDGLWLGDMDEAAPRVLRVDLDGKILWSRATTLPAGSLALVP